VEVADVQHDVVLITPGADEVKPGLFGNPKFVMLALLVLLWGTASAAPPPGVPDGWSDSYE
jgi:hypothetical protein